MTVYTADGTPARPELEQAVRQLDSNLGIRWIFGGWAVTFKWPEADTRRQMVRQGVMDPEGAFDVLCYLPKDCSPEHAPDYIEHHCVHWARDMGRADVARLLDHIHDHNAKQAARNAQSSADYAEERFETNKATIAEDLGVHVVKPVFQSEYLANQHPQKTKRKKGKDL